MLSQLGPGPAQQPQQDCTAQHIPVCTSQAGPAPAPLPTGGLTKPRVCSWVQYPMAAPPRGRLSPGEPQGTGMAQLQFWAPQKEAQGLVWAQFISRSALASGHYAPSRAVLQWILRREENVFDPRGRKCWVQPLVPRFQMCSWTMSQMSRCLEPSVRLLHCPPFSTCVFYITLMFCTQLTGVSGHSLSSPLLLPSQFINQTIKM